MIPYFGLPPSLTPLSTPSPLPQSLAAPHCRAPVTSLVRPLSRDTLPWIHWLTLPMLPRAPSCRPWFLMEDSKNEPWAALLRSTVSGDVDLTPNGQPLPPLPAFSSQVCPEALMGNGLGEDSPGRWGRSWCWWLLSHGHLLFRSLCLTQSPLCLLGSSLWDPKLFPGRLFHLPLVALETPTNCSMGLEAPWGHLFHP